MMSMRRKLSIDLFAGAGGLSEGLAEAGFVSLFASEIVPVYAQTYRKNHVNASVETADIRGLDAVAIRERLGLARGELDLIAGGPPCQGFSINAPVRSPKDQRNHLFKEYLRFVEAFAPKAVLIENVPGLVSFERGATLQAILDALADLGYGANVRILGAAYYGVPQMRWRTIILGVRGRELPGEAFPEPICHAPIRPNFTTTFNGRQLVKQPSFATRGTFVTVAEAIGDLPPLESGERGATVKDYAMPPWCAYQRWCRTGSPGVLNHEAPRLSAINLERLRHIRPGGNWTDIPDGLLPKGMQCARKSDHTKRYGRLLPNGLASTVLTKCDPHWGAFFSLRARPFPHGARGRPYSILPRSLRFPGQHCRTICPGWQRRSAASCRRRGENPLGCFGGLTLWQAQSRSFSDIRRKT